MLFFSFVVFSSDEFRAVAFHCFFRYPGTYHPLLFSSPLLTVGKGDDRFKMNELILKNAQQHLWCRGNFLVLLHKEGEPGYMDMNLTEGKIAFWLLILYIPLFCISCLSTYRLASAIEEGNLFPDNEEDSTEFMGDEEGCADLTGDDDIAVDNAGISNKEKGLEELNDV